MIILDCFMLMIQRVTKKATESWDAAWNPDFNSCLSRIQTFQSSSITNTLCFLSLCCLSNNVDPRHPDYRYLSHFQSFPVIFLEKTPHNIIPGRPKTKMGNNRMMATPTQSDIGFYFLFQGTTDGLNQINESFSTVKGLEWNQIKILN